MSQITKTAFPLMLVLIGLMLVTSCGTSNPQASFDADSQQHAEGWLPAGHMTAAQADSNSCTPCHGADFAGGISGVSCTTCHLGGPLSVHPAGWSGDLSLHGRYSVANGNTSCRNVYCHGYNLNGVVNSGPSCSNGINDVRCHM